MHGDKEKWERKCGQVAEDVRERLRAYAEFQPGTFNLLFELRLNFSGLLTALDLAIPQAATENPLDALKPQLSRCAAIGLCAKDGDVSNM